MFDRCERLLIVMDEDREVLLVCLEHWVSVCFVPYSGVIFYAVWPSTEVGWVLPPIN